MNYRNHITIEANKRGGKPCVRGLRITVYEVLEYLASEMTEAEILDDFPDLTREDLKACIAYAADRERRFITATLSECDGLSAKVAEESQYLVLSNEQLRFPKIFGTKSKNRSKFYI